ncbi:thioredoxin family protein [Sulfurimonas marina]|uniref:Thioredoxin-like fold domain-containing protein n=1 Tax=Sulfurimonas marina TaxID=2590551 RepID=A0A7M1AXS1_9BACT|nr:thioredoxin fold domain-containing protein [Sulfurimonas marina]QOP42243.1 hypothetical protein FJR03_11040 [Sulfurimonas marina]
MLKKSLLSILYIFILSVTQLSAEIIDIDKAVLASKKSGKNPLVYLHKTGCPYCERLEEFTLDDDDVDQYIKDNFTFIIINVSHKEDIVIYDHEQTTAKAFAENIGYNFYPSVLFFSNSGELDHGSIGYIEEKDFLIILKYMKTGAFKTMSIDEYKKKIGFVEENNGEQIDKRQKL